MDKGSGQIFFFKDMTNNHMKKLSILSVIRQMQIKATVIHHFAPPTRMTIIKRLITSGGEDVEKLEPSYFAGGNTKGCRHFGKWAGQPCNS